MLVSVVTQIKKVLEQEAGYLAGYAAALQSKTGKVGYIGGAKIPAVVKFGVGFVQGAKAAKKRHQSCLQLQWFIQRH